MLETLRIVTVILVVFAFAPALAHALELPGKLRLSHDAYFATQRIYYPGFTVAGISEPLALIATISLLAIGRRYATAGSFHTSSGRHSPASVWLRS